MINFMMLDTEVVTLDGGECTEFDITKCCVYMASGIKIVRYDGTIIIRIFECPETLEAELQHYFTDEVGATNVLFYKSKSQVCKPVEKVDTTITVCAWCNRLTDGDNISYGQEVSKKTQLSKRMSHGICRICATTFAKKNNFSLSKLNLGKEERYEY